MMAGFKSRHLRYICLFFKLEAGAPLSESLGRGGLAVTRSQQKLFLGGFSPLCLPPPSPGPGAGSLLKEGAPVGISGSWERSY